LIVIDHYYNGPFPKMGLQPMQSKGFKLSMKILNRLTPPSNAMVENLYFTPSSGKVHFAVTSPVTDKSYGFRDSQKSHVFQLSVKDYRHAKAHPSIFKQMMRDPSSVGDLEQICLDESAVKPQALSFDEADILIQAFSQGELWDVINVLLMHKVRSDFSARVSLPGCDPERIVFCLLKMLPYTDRILNYTTMDYPPQMPEGPYILTVNNVQPRRVSVENHGESDYSPLVDNLIERLLKRDVGGVYSLQEEYASQFD